MDLIADRLAGPDLDGRAARGARIQGLCGSNSGSPHRARLPRAEGSTRSLAHTGIPFRGRVTEVADVSPCFTLVFLEEDYFWKRGELRRAATTEDFTGLR